MTDDEKNKIRRAVQLDNEKFLAGLAPLYLGKQCPRTQSECLGPACAVFLITENVTDAGRTVTGGACSEAIVASQMGAVIDGLGALLQRATEKPLQTIIPTAGR